MGDLHRQLRDAEERFLDEPSDGRCLRHVWERTGNADEHRCACGETAWPNESGFVERGVGGMISADCDCDECLASWDRFVAKWNY